MYIVSVCFGIVTISVLCTVIEIKTEVELICLAVCLGLSLEDLVLEQPIFKSAHNKKTTEGFFSSKHARQPFGCLRFTHGSKCVITHFGWANTKIKMHECLEHLLYN